MVIPSRLTLALGALCIALCALLYWQVRASGALSARAEAAEKALSAAAEQRKKDAQLLTARRAEIASEARKSAAARAALAEALRANESWAGTSVPPEVQRALGGAVEGLE